MDNQLRVLWDIYCNVIEASEGEEQGMIDEALENFWDSVNFLQDQQLSSFYALLADALRGKNYYCEKIQIKIGTMFENTGNVLVQYFFACILEENYRKMEFPEKSEVWRKRAAQYTDVFLKTNILQDRLSRYVKSEKTLMYYYIKKYLLRRRKNMNEDELLVLKGWSSATPLIVTDKKSSIRSGGGFFCRYHGIGIAIDPGCNFLDNLHRCGLQLFDINIVIVTHNHMDHMNDVNILKNLLYEYDRFKERYPIQDEIKKQLFEHQIEWYFDEQLYEKLKGEDDFKEHIHKVCCKKDTYNKTNCNYLLSMDEFDKFSIELHAFLTDHNANLPSFGMKLVLKDEKKCIQLGYTSDTKYNSSICDELKGSDIIIGNISEITDEDLKNEIKAETAHLGLEGCLRIIRNCQPKLFLISEFWGGKGDMRLLISKILEGEMAKRGNVQNKTEIIPADIGLLVNLNDLAITCSVCGRRMFSEKIETVAPPEPYGKLSYVCDYCRSHTDSIF